MKHRVARAKQKTKTSTGRWLKKVYSRRSVHCIDAEAVAALRREVRSLRRDIGDIY